MNSFFTSYPVENASKDDAIVYVSLLLSLASVDGIDELEFESIKQLVVNNGWDLDIFVQAQKNTNLTIDSLNLSSEFIQVVGPYLIRDLCAIAYLSNGFSDIEEKYINSTCEHIGMTKDDYEKIKKAVSCQMESINNWSEVVSVQ